MENLNTVLDDNKKLCLNSGEIIKLLPQLSCQIIKAIGTKPATISYRISCKHGDSWARLTPVTTMMFEVQSAVVMRCQVEGIFHASSSNVTWPCSSLLRLQVEDLAVASPATARVPGKTVARLRPVPMPMIDKGIGLDTSPKINRSLEKRQTSYYRFI